MDALESLPETILQFGAGRFLRSFADLFVQEANEAGQAVGRIVIVQSTPGPRAQTLGAQNGRYHVLVQGRTQGRVIDEVKEVRCISRALTAADDWQQVRQVVRSPELRYILSNVTEVGYTLDPADCLNGSAPASYPARLADLLHQRYQAGQDGLLILPCELIDDNADRLREAVIDRANLFGLGNDFIGWLTTRCRWANALVDRIVSVPAPGHPLAATDKLLTMAEPFADWFLDEAATEGFFTHPAIHRVADVRPYSLRKIRIVNGGHTALVCKALPMGIITVRQAAEHPVVGPWLRSLLFDEIVPVIAGRAPGSQQFAEQMIDRITSPFLEHKLTDISLHHATKVRQRLLPTRDEYRQMFHRDPPCLSEAIALAGA